MSSPITLSAQQLTRFHGKRRVVSDVSLELRRGEVLGLLGHNGAGKSTTLQMLAGALTPDSGLVEVCDFDLAQHPELGKACLGFLPEQPPLYRDMRVDDFLIFAARLHRVAPAKLADHLALAKQRCGLTDCGNKLISTLSKGYQQRAGIAQAIIHQPAVVILDEPTVGLDPTQIRDIRNLIRELGNSSSVILSTHILNEVENICDRAIILQEGKVIFSGGIDELRHHSDVESSFIRLTAMSGNEGQKQ
ncbi:MAG: ABC transporter ATP-binding protein [Sideroxydans sp.]|nr:ABC transporter ATP-binding protein [Sideroxydans sp.]